MNGSVPSVSAPWSSKSDNRGAALTAHDLGKRFGERLAFEGVSFEIGYGEVFGFLGPNGAGKTTTVRTLSTLIAPTAGADVLSIGESHRSLEDVYLQLIDEDREAATR